MATQNLAQQQRASALATEIASTMTRRRLVALGRPPHIEESEVATVDRPARGDAVDLAIRDHEPPVDPAPVYG